MRFRMGADRGLSPVPELAAAERSAASNIIRNCVHSSWEYTDPSAYVDYPAGTDLVRAHELLAAGDVAGAMAIFRRHQKAHAANDWIVAAAVPMLESLGHKAEAEEIFRARIEATEEACRRFPTDPQRHRDLAWFCAIFARDLDKALEHSRRAVELAPNDGQFARYAGRSPLSARQVQGSPRNIPEVLGNQPLGMARGRPAPRSGKIPTRN